jgi:hypothetical protein
MFLPNLTLAAALLLFAAIPFVLFVLTTEKAMKYVSFNNRRISASLVWLYMLPVPLICHLWYYYLVVQVSLSLRAEYRERGIAMQVPPTLISGLAMNTAFLAAYIPQMPAWLGGMLAFVTFLIHWSRMTEASRKLQQDSSVLINPDFQ